MQNFYGWCKYNDKDFTVSIKADQDNVGTTTMGSGNMKLNLDASVGNLSFADNSSSDWGSGKLIINGFINVWLGLKWLNRFNNITIR